MFAKRHTILMSASILVAASGCATNALRIEYASDVAQKGTAVAAASSEYLSNVERARYAINADIIAADAACWGRRKTIRERPDLVRVMDPRTPPRGWLCEELPQGQTSAQGLALFPIDAELRPTLAIIQALSAYSAAITKILDAPAANPVADLNNALASARAAEDLLRAIRNDGGPTLVPAADDARLGAVTGLIAFISELSNERITVERLKALRARNGSSLALVNALDDHLRNWEQSRLASESFGFQLSDSLLGAATRQDSSLNAAQRRTYAEDYYGRARTRAAAAQLSAALRVVIAALREAETDYDNLLSEHPRLNQEMRMRRAEIIRQRVTRAFEIATTLITAFRGA